MKLRRCKILLFEPTERLHFALSPLLAGGTGMQSELRLMALAPHLDEPVEVDVDEVGVLAALSPSRWVDAAAFDRRFGHAVVRRLRRIGLAISDQARWRAFRERDETVRAAHWHPAAAVLQLGGRWKGIAAGEQATEAGMGTMGEMIAALGPPPAAWTERRPPTRRLRLGADEPRGLGGLFAARTTCRNFADVAVSRRDFERILYRAGAAYGRLELGGGVEVLKKGSPTGGGLAPIECYVLVRRVDGIAPGLYHHHPIDHALERLDGPRSAKALRELAARMVAGQQYFADAAALVILVARFGRIQWKYRNHAKAYRSVVLEAGHTSQGVYLSAAAAGLGAYVTAAINEVDIENALQLDPLVETPLAICGIGVKENAMTTFELRPLRGRGTISLAEAKRKGATGVRHSVAD